MAIPSGSGTEVLRRNSIPAQSTSITSIDWAQAVQTAAGNSSGTTAVPANVIITIINIIICNRNASSRTIDMLIDGTGTAVRPMDSQPISSKGTFEFSDRFVLREGDELQFDSSGSDIDIYISYIYQQLRNCARWPGPAHPGSAQLGPARPGARPPGAAPRRPPTQYPKIYNIFF